MVVPVPVGSYLRGASGATRGYFAQVEHTGTGGDRVEFESDVEPCTIGHQLRNQYVFCELGLYTCYRPSGTESSIPSEPMTTISCVSSSELIPVPNKPTTDKVDTPKVSESPAAASKSTAITPTPSTAARNPLAIQLVSFFDNIQRIFKVPTSVGLTHRGFEVTFSAESIPWLNLLLGASNAADGDANAEDRRVFEIMPEPANAALHRYIKDLAHVRMELDALQTAEEDEVVKKLELRIKEEQETASSWMKRVCEAAGGLGIAEPAFSLRK